jgi:uncharacterized membrane protein (Fun14 family)
MDFIGVGLAAAANVTNATLVENIAFFASNPAVLASFVIQFLLGLGAGYYMAKIAKYIVALIAIFILGALIGAWGVSGSVEEALKNLGASVAESKDAIISIMKAFGFVLVGPTAIGFIVGILLGLLRK